MNQTNFGYNPARNTLVTQQNEMFDSVTSPQRQQLNTQKRTRTQTIDAQANHLRGNSLYVEQMQNAYSVKQGPVMTMRQPHHQLQTEPPQMFQPMKI